MRHTKTVIWETYMEKRNKEGLTEAQFLAQYDENKYRHPSVTTDMATFTIVGDKLCILMIKRANHPFIGGYALPGGFLEMEENLESCAARELFEETGVTDTYFYQVGAYGDVNRDPRTRVISVLYTAFIENINAKAGDDAADAVLFEVNAERLPNDVDSDAIYKLTLTGETRLEAVLKLNTQGLCDKTECISSDMASDHGAMIFDALRLLSAKKQAIAEKCPEW